MASITWQQIASQVKEAGWRNVTATAIRLELSKAVADRTQPWAVLAARILADDSERN